VSLAIVFDDGNDGGEGCVYPDDVQIGRRLWTSAPDNSNGEAIMPR